MGLFSSPDREKLQRMGERNPRELKNNLQMAADCLRSRDERDVEYALYAVGELSKIDPEAAIPVLPESAGHLQPQRSETIKNNALRIVLEVSKEQPEEVAEYTDDIVDTFEGLEMEGARVYAIKCLMNLEHAGSTQALKDIKDQIGDVELRQEVMDAIDGGEDHTYAPKETEQGTESREKSGILKNCPDCSTDFTTLSGIPRTCPGCGKEIKKLL
jgi:hypothetical protein